MEPEARYEAGGASLIDVNAVDLQQYPKFAKAKFNTSVLKPGDCMFGPARMLHQVTSPAGRSLAVSILFAEERMHSCCQ